MTRDGLVTLLRDVVGQAFQERMPGTLNQNEAQVRTIEEENIEPVIIIFRN